MNRMPIGTAGVAVVAAGMTFAVVAVAAAEILWDHCC